jgi:hypothetical protein
MITSEEKYASNSSRLTEGAPTMNSLKLLARIAGVLYLLVGIFGGFAQGFVYPMIYGSSDAATTVGSILANSELVRIGIVADLFQATLLVFVALTLYQLFKHVNKGMAGAMVVLAAIAATITCLNVVFEFEALQVATGAVNLNALGTASLNGLVLLLVDAHHYGLLTAQIFFSLWLVPMGYLAYKSGWFPKALGSVLVAASISYLVDMLLAFLAPAFGKEIHSYLSILPAIAEIWMVGYLLVIGVRTVTPAKRVIAAVTLPGAQA